MASFHFIFTNQMVFCMLKKVYHSCLVTVHAGGTRRLVHALLFKEDLSLLQKKCDRSNGKSNC